MVSYCTRIQYSVLFRNVCRNHRSSKLYVPYLPYLGLSDFGLLQTYKTRESKFGNSSVSFYVLVPVKLFTMMWLVMV